MSFSGQTAFVYSVNCYALSVIICSIMILRQKDIVASIAENSCKVMDIVSGKEMI